jgi:DNA-binding transcriptional LysR family regulator
LSRHGVPAPRILEFGTLEAIFGCVSADMGVTLLPRAMIGPVWSKGHIAIHELPPRDGLVETVFVRLRDGHVSSALSAFLAIVAAKPDSFDARAAVE